MRRPSRQPRSLVLAVAMASITAWAAGSAWAVAPASASSATLAGVPTSFHLSGSGWGHGVGLSQYGALGMAKEGSTAAHIITHYYTGTAVTPYPDTMDVRVNLLHAVSSATLGSQALGTGGGTVEVTVAGLAPVLGSTADHWGIAVAGTSVAVTKNGLAVGTGSMVTVRWAGTRSPGTAGTAATALLVGSQAYRYGFVDARVVSGAIELVNTVRLHDEYLLGVSEMTSTWLPAAVQAQVIASRSYALAKYAAGLRTSCSCHLYDDTYDQVFLGWGKESGVGGSSWRAAVLATLPSATTGLTVTYAGVPITGYFFSSSGGRTENSEDVWGGTLPWARSVDDHWSLDPTVNPSLALWTRDPTQAQVAAVFGLPDVVKLDLSRRTAGLEVDSAVAWSAAGASATISGSALRSGLGLLSGWLHRPVARYSGTDRWGTAVAVATVAYPSSTGVVVVSGETEHLVDGMVAAPLAVRKAAPILLASLGGLPAATSAEITRRHATTAWMVGGTGSLGPEVEAQLRALGVTTVIRLAGADRYATAAAVARALGVAVGGTAAIVNGADVAGALAVAGPAARSGRPVLLVAADNIPAATSAVLTDLGITAVTVVGGTGVVSDAVVSTLPHPYRAAGVDRYATAAAVATAFASLTGTASVVVASGLDASLVDALSAGALGRPVLLTAGGLPAATTDWLQRSPSMARLLVIGGTGVVPETTATAGANA